MPSPCRVAIIGCGPGGLFFLHHLAEKRRKYILEGSTEKLEGLPEVTCFEKSHTHGGNWRADWVQSDSLWTNAPKEAIEFFDYTFAEHFGEGAKLPVFLPRASVLKYMTARVTKNTPDFFDQYVEFNTNVDKVTYKEETQKFTLQTTDLTTGKETQGVFDKCIWAAGECGTPNEPKALVDAFSGFRRGLAVHSGRFRDWQKNARGKHVLLIGGSYTALDMAYLAIKNKASKVTILVRKAHRDVPVCWIEAWPEGKVEVVKNMVPLGINESTQAVICGPKYNSDDDKDETVGEKVEIESVDTVIYCTGYKAGQVKLDDSIYNGYDFDAEDEIVVPQDWTMKRHPLNDLITRNIPPPSKVYGSDFVECFYAHHDCIMASNHNFMFPCAAVDQHILGIDITTYYMLSVILGETIVPSMQQIHKRNKNLVLEAMNNPFFRGHLDDEYNKAVEEVYWDSANQEALGKMDLSREKTSFYLEMLGQKARDCNYPVDIGGVDGLTARGEALLLYDELAYLHQEGKTVETAGTIHDIPDEMCAKVKSIHTGNRSYALKQPWMDLDHTLDPLDMVEGNNKVLAALDLDKERWVVPIRETNPIDGPL